MKNIYLILIVLMPVFMVNAGTEIVGGESIEITTRPFQVSLQYSSDNEHFCGGAIIADNWVITAAHCIENTDPATIQVLAGASILSESNVGQVLEVEDIYSHVYVDDINDIALLKLKGNFTFNSNVAIIPLLTKVEENAGKLDHGTNAYVSGWGALDEEGANYPDTLMGVAVKIVANDTAKAGDYPELIHSHVVAGKGIGKDACYGDSGGPLTIEDNGVTKLTGLVSYGLGCGTNYGIYCRVSAYENWIDNIMNDRVSAFFNMEKTILTGDHFTAEDRSFNKPTSYLWNLSKKDSSTVLVSDSTKNFSGILNEPGWYTLTLTVRNVNSVDSIVFDFEVLEAPEICGKLNVFDNENLTQIHEDNLRVFSWDWTDYVGFSFQKDSKIMVVDSVCFNGEFEDQPPSGTLHISTYFDVYHGENMTSIGSTALFSDLKKGKNCGALEKQVILRDSGEVIFLMATYFDSPDGEDWYDVFFDGFYLSNYDRYKPYGYYDNLFAYEKVNGMNILPAISLGVCSNENNLTSSKELTNSQKELIIYPNPATDQIMVPRNSIGSYEIISAQGSVLLKGTLNGQTNINIDKLNSGAYHVKFNDVSGLQTGTFIKL